MSASRTPLTELLRRLTAAGIAALVFALSVFAASPELHDELHEADHADDTDGCAVVLFAAGVSLPLAPIAALPPSVAWRTQSPALAEEILLASPRYLRQPERGPPALGGIVSGCSRRR